MELLFGNGAKKGGTNDMIGGSGGGDLIKDSDTAHFMQDVIEASMQVPVIVDFWAPWCGPCKTLGPLLEKLVKAAKGTVKLVKIDVDANQDLAAQMRIQSVPMVYAFDQGRPVDGFSGAVGESQLKAFIGRLTGGAGHEGVEDALAQAKALLAEGQVPQAQQIYQQILAADHANAPALGGFLRCLLALGETDNAAAMLARLPEELAKHADIAAVRTALELASQGEAGATAELRRRLAQDHNDHQARFDLAMAYFATGEREAAVDELLEIVRRDRAWQDDGARKQLLKLFEAFGPGDPLAAAGRRRLSSLLFA
ncbi:MAG TPA: co-chaperone YbbN [Candidatus Sulfotelmatobacter sp.]|jgi:putative thioredoxin|nr:co-chaperone YbbN [Candidatus Sulfotelmatobacter sp.]